MADESLRSPFSTYLPAATVQADIAKQAGGALGPDGLPQVDHLDPAFQPPTSPLIGNVQGRTQLVYRDLPITTIATTWTVDQVKAALSEHVNGYFNSSGQLVDSILGDDRVQATLGSRISGLFGREIRFKPANESQEALDCLEAWKECWRGLGQGFALHDMHTYSILMGFSVGQLLWDTSGDIWRPYLRPWHPRFTYYHWSLRKYVALSMDGSMPIVPGDGKWVLHAPFGDYRGWIRGGVRSIAEPWLIRHFAYRDWARYSEVHGMPIRKAIVPASSDEIQRDRFQQQLVNLGQETTIMVSQGADQMEKYDLELIEATDRAWESFPGLIDRCDMSIVLSLLFQNLTTEVKGGSLAATEAHMDIRQSGIEADNTAFCQTIREQIAKPFAFLNFGDAELAPITDWDVTARQDYVENAKMFQQFGTAVEVLRRGGVEFNEVEELRKWSQRKFGLSELPDFKITDPVSGGGIGK